LTIAQYTGRWPAKTGSCRNAAKSTSFAAHTSTQPRNTDLHSCSDREACERRARSRSCVQSRDSLLPLSFCAACARCSAALRMISSPGKERAEEGRDGGGCAGGGRGSAAGAVDVGSDVVCQGSSGGGGGCGGYCGRDSASMSCEGEDRCWEEEPWEDGEANGTTRRL